jgi:serine/threonine protein kinase
VHGARSRAEERMPQRSELGGRLQAALGDSYEVQEKLASGGMATVFLVREPKADRLVALKVLHPELVKGVGTHRFRHEVAVASRLDHPNILPVLDHGEAGETPFGGRNAQAVVSKMFASSAPSVRLVRPDVPVAVDDAIQRALSRSRNDRFASISEFARSLHIAPSDARAGLGGTLTKLAKRLRAWCTRE